MADFGNYPNMGYCVVENTVNSMRQLAGGFSEADSIEELDLNEYEQRAYRELYELCEEIMHHMNRFDEQEETEEE